MKPDTPPRQEDQISADEVIDRLDALIGNRGPVDVIRGLCCVLYDRAKRALAAGDIVHARRWSITAKVISKQADRLEKKPGWLF